MKHIKDFELNENWSNQDSKVLNKFVDALHDMIARDEKIEDFMAKVEDYFDRVKPEYAEKARAFLKKISE